MYHKFYLILYYAYFTINIQTYKLFLQNKEIFFLFFDKVFLLDALKSCPNLYKLGLVYKF